MHISVAQVGWPSLQFPRCVWDNWQGNLKGKWGTHHVKWKVTAKVSLPFHFQDNSMDDYGIATWIWTCDHKSQMVGVKLLAGASLRRVDVTCVCVSWVELGSDFGHGRYLEERHIDIMQWYTAVSIESSPITIGDEKKARRQDNFELGGRRSLLPLSLFVNVIASPGLRTLDGELQSLLHHGLWFTDVQE